VRDIGTGMAGSRDALVCGGGWRQEGAGLGFRFGAALYIRAGVGPMGWISTTLDHGLLVLVL
jgi:hypothetical protein